jgi:hypothetical protein
VIGGKISTEQLIKHLQLLVPGKWNWEIQEQDERFFVVPFPSKAELQRTMAYGGAEIKELGIQLKFEEFAAVQEGMVLPRFG